MEKPIAARVAQALTMSTLEIAEVCDKQHWHVLRDVREMLKALYGDDSNLDHQQIQGVSIEKDARGYIKEIHLDHSHAITLVAGYKARYRKAIIDRWLKLETAALQAAAPAPDASLLAQRLRTVQIEVLRARPAWRRTLALLDMGCTQSMIAAVLKVHQRTAEKYVAALRRCGFATARRQIAEKSLEELVGLPAPAQLPLAL